MSQSNTQDVVLFRQDDPERWSKLREAIRDSWLVRTVEKTARS